MIESFLITKSCKNPTLADSHFFIGVTRLTQIVLINISGNRTNKQKTNQAELTWLSWMRLTNLLDTYLEMGKFFFGLCHTIVHRFNLRQLVHFELIEKYLD